MPAAAFLPTPAVLSRPSFLPRPLPRPLSRRVLTHPSPLRRPRLPSATLSPSEYDSLFGAPETPSQRFQAFSSSPRRFTALTPLAFSGDKAFLSDASGKLAVPAPLPLSLDFDVGLFRDAIAIAHGGQARDFGHVEARSTLVRADAWLRKVLEGGDVDDLISRIGVRVWDFALGGGVKGCLGVLACALEVGARRVVACSVEEAEGVREECCMVVGYAYVADVAVLGGEKVVSGAVRRVECNSPAFAVAVAAGCGVECLIERSLFEATAVRVRVGVSGPDGRAVVEEDDGDEGEKRESDEVGSGAESGARGSWGDLSKGEEYIPWKCDYRNVRAMSDESLRAGLRAVGRPVALSMSRNELLRRFADEMDSVERRELLMEIAAEVGEYRLAARLQSERCERGLVAVAMREAEAKGDWDAAFRLTAKAADMKARLQDCTADPGSYDPYLDADPDYRPSR